MYLSSIVKYKMDEITHLIELVDQFAKTQDDNLLLPFELTAKQRAAIHIHVGNIPGIYSESISINTSKLKLIKLHRGDAKNIPHIIDTDDIDIFTIYSGIPIPCPHPKYINSYIETLDPLYNSIRHWDLYKKEYQTINFRSEIKKLEKTIKEDIKKNESFVRLTIHRHTMPTNLVNDKLYTYDNLGKVFISIDIKQANFSVLNYKCPTLFNGLSWQEYVGKHTKSQFIAESKFFRELILGSIGFQKVSNIIQAQIIESIHSIVKPHFDFKIVSKKGDEVVYEITPELLSDPTFESKINDLYALISSQQFGKMFHLQVFKLENMEKKAFYVKKFIWNSNNIGSIHKELRYHIEFKCIPKKFIIQALHKYLNQPIKNEELYFVDDGVLAKYEYPIFEYSLDIGQ